MNDRVVFDCNVFAQAILSPRGPAGQCMSLAQTGQIELFVSEFVLGEISELHLKLPVRTGVTADDTEDLAQLVRTFAKVLDPVPSIFVHPIDPDDSAYVNLAIAANAELIVSRDKHLLGLNDPSKPWTNEFCSRFPALRVLAPDQFLAEHKKKQEENRE
jgi:putative PIN family toxin of toxin-antitoxin system